MILNEAKNSREREMLVEAYARLWTADIVSNGMINELAPLLGALAQGAATAARVGGQAVAQGAKAGAKAAAQGVKAVGKQGAKAAKQSGKKIGQAVKDKVKDKAKDALQDKAEEMIADKAEELGAQQKLDTKPEPEVFASPEGPGVEDQGTVDDQEAIAAKTAESLDWMQDADKNLANAMAGFKNLNGSADSLQTSVETCFNSISNDEIKGMMTKGAEDAVSSLQSAYEGQLQNVMSSIAGAVEKAGVEMDENQVKSAAIISMAAAIAKLTKEIANAK